MGYVKLLATGSTLEAWSGGLDVPCILHFLHKEISTIDQLNTLLCRAIEIKWFKVFVKENMYNYLESISSKYPNPVLKFD